MANLSNIISSLTLTMQIVHGTHWYCQCRHQIKFPSLQCLSNPFLNVSVFGASITLAGILLHKFAIYKLKKFGLMLALENFV